MADILPGVDLSSGNQVMGGIMAGFGNIMNTVVMIIAFLFVGLLIFGIVLLINKLFFEFTIPVQLKFKVGSTMLVDKDLMKIKKKNDKYEVKFKKYRNLIAEEPPDVCACFFKLKGKNKKGFEGEVVSENQVVWLNPLPIEKEVVTMPTNLIRHYVSMSQANRDIATKLKWYQNPMILGFAMVGALIVGIIFIYIMHKSVVEEVGQLLGILASKMS